MADITSRQHSIVQQFKTAARGEGDHVLLDGWHLLHDAFAAGVDLTTVAIADDPPSAHDAALLDRLVRHINVFTVTTPVMNAISPVRTPAGVVALATRREYPLERLLQPAPALVVLAADIQDPGNVGAIVRSAEAGGATGVLLTGASSDPWGWKALRAAMGSTFRLPIFRSRGDTPLADLRSRGLTIIATVPRGGTEMHRVDLRTPTVIVIGSEGAGLDERLVRAADVELSIPMHGPVESLNVAVAAALLVYEARRQREA